MSQNLSQPHGEVADRGGAGGVGAEGPRPGATGHSIDRIRAVNEQIIEVMSSSGLHVLDTYEQALKTALEMHVSMAESTHIEWVNAMARAQAQFISQVSAFYTKAARDMLG